MEQIIKTLFPVMVTNENYQFLVAPSNNPAANQFYGVTVPILVAVNEMNPQ